MADITALENRIRSLIKINGNQEITGAVAQQILLDIADSLNAYLEAEASSRQSGDSTLQGQINNETQQRQNADTALGQRITNEIQQEAGARQNAVQQEAQRAEAAFDDLDLIDAAGSTLQPTQITLTLRKNDGSEQEPDWRTLAELVLPSATEQKAGLVNAEEKAFLNTRTRAAKLDNSLLLNAGITLISNINLICYEKLINKYLQTDNTLSSTTHPNWNTFYKIPVKAGDIIYYNKKSISRLNSSASYYIITNSQGTVLVQRDGTDTPADVFGEFVYTMTVDGFVSLCVLATNGIVDSHDEIGIIDKRAAARFIEKLKAEIDQSIINEKNRAEAAFDDLDLIDAAGSTLQPTQITLTLRKNDGSEQEPDWRTLAELVLPSATEQKAGLMNIYFRNSIKQANNAGLELISKYLQTDNMLSSTVSTQWKTYYKIPVKAGDAIYYNKRTNEKLADVASYYIITDSEGTVLVQRDGTNTDADMFGEFTYVMPVDGFVSLCTFTTNPNLTDDIIIFRLGGIINSLLSRVTSLENDVEELNAFKQNIEDNDLLSTDLIDDATLVNRYLQTNNTLSSATHPNWNTYYKIPVKAGDVVYYKKIGSSKLNSSASYYIITDLQGTVLVQRNGTNTDADMFGEFTYVMPVDGFVSLCVYAENGEIKTVWNIVSITEYLKTKVENLQDDVDNINDKSIVLSPFKGVYKFGVVGDSLSVGHMTDPTSGSGVPRNLKFSWGQILARKNGQVCLNFGFSGASATTWFTNTTYNCPSVLSASENKCQVYIIGLGANTDAGGIGSMSDIDWNNRDNNAATYYGQYARIIQLIREVSPKAIIFCLTLPYPRENTDKNNAIKAICADSHVSSHCYVIDLTKYNSVLKQSIVGNLVSGGNYDKYYYESHFTAPGYAMCAEMINEAISEVMNANADDDVILSIGQIPFGNNDIIE